MYYAPQPHRPARTRTQRVLDAIEWCVERLVLFAVWGTFWAAVILAISAIGR